MSETALPVLADFLSNVPPQLTAALVHLAPMISFVACVAQLASWRSSWYDSCILLASWWAICILAVPILRYLFPAALLIALTYARYKSRNRTVRPLITENTLQLSITQLSVIQSLLPSPPSLPETPTSVLLRVAIILYPPYLFFTRYVSLRVITAVLGTVFLTWRAPWAIILRANIRRSAWCRWAGYHTMARITGQPLPPRALSLQPTSTTPKPVNSLRFLFTIYENQRWWMGLDWTAALLPGERPSWCSISQHPVSPPNAFTLPDNTTVYLPDKEGHRLKRTAVWSWEDPEWRVLVRKEGGSLSRVERPLPIVEKEPSTNGSRLLKAAAGRLRDSAPGANDKNTQPSQNSEQHEGEEQSETTEEEPATDTDGWVYGDNKWEAQSSRGGMGKYTRYRRWTRVAVVAETVEVVDDGEAGIQRTVRSSIDEPAPAVALVQPTSELSKSDIPSTDGSPPDSPLRQRLRKALTKGST
ncbi:Peroxin/Dysferlin domain-containing protein [Crucibulum laeve]|uniref:Peroxin/Dysferlin domain-containing protein n=1 Tax=Crucibulum laeve TaxID=68775 RepID=A0A5C3MH78_9AGAR|nr:Peroxin/Dysferlin domain-containing protein [Crucibulum laeve]